MRYKNPTERPLDFGVRGHQYKVAPGGTCDIPVELEFALKARGLPLERDPVDGEEIEDAIPELPPDWRGAALPSPGTTARLWLTRALEAHADATRERERADAAEERIDDGERYIDTLRAELEVAYRQRDEALALIEAVGATKPEGEVAPPADVLGAAAARGEDTKTSAPADTDAAGGSRRTKRG